MFVIFVKRKQPLDNDRSVSGFQMAQTSSVTEGAAGDNIEPPGQPVKAAEKRPDLFDRTFNRNLDVDFTHVFTCRGGGRSRDD